MQLINHTPLTSLLQPMFDLRRERCRAILTAQATFVIGGSGEATLDDQAPLALSEAEEPYGDHWSLPACSGEEPASGFEVMLIGSVRCLEPKPMVRVRMQVGDEERVLLAFGDRRWSESDDGWRLGEPVPFRELPLCWARAYGGHVNAEIDPGAWVPMFHDLNPRGRGYCPTEKVMALGDLIPSDPGFPKTPEPGLAPNLVAEGDSLSTPFEEPLPVCWAPVPRTHTLRYHDLEGNVVADDAGAVDRQRAHRFAHPCWYLPQEPPVGAPVEVEAGDSRLQFALPALIPSVDYRVRQRSGRLPLRAVRLLVLLDERRAVVTHQTGIEIGDEEYGDTELRLVRGGEP